MLGWFKKKFGKQDKPKEQQPVEQEVVQPAIAEEPEIIQEVVQEVVPEHPPVQSPEVAAVSAETEQPEPPVAVEIPEEPVGSETSQDFASVGEPTESEPSTARELVADKELLADEERAEQIQSDENRQEPEEVIDVIDLKSLEEVETEPVSVLVSEESPPQEEPSTTPDAEEPEPEVIAEESEAQPEPESEPASETASVDSEVEEAGEQESTTVLEAEEVPPEQALVAEESAEETEGVESIVTDVSEPAAPEEEEPPKPQYQQPAEKPSMPKKNFDSRSRESSTSTGLFSRLSKRLSKTRESFTYQMDALFLGKKEIDTNLLDDLEEILILADLGVNTTQDLLEHARRRVKRKELKDPAALRQLLKDKISEYIVSNDQDAALVMPDEGPFVIMVIGVNGVGKTTTIGKIAKKFINAGSSVMLVAADTFRAAAIAQLQIWGERNNVPVIAHKEGADPSSVVYDGLDAAIAQQVDVVLVDTAGRLHTKANLMEELKKIKRVMNKRLPGAPHETLLVIDATTGQNGVSQAKLFNEAVEVTGLALTKLDGTSKGGIVANICKDLKIPIRFIGIGEQVDDLRDFESGEFVDALFQSRSNNE